MNTYGSRRFTGPFTVPFTIRTAAALLFRLSDPPEGKPAKQAEQSAEGAYKSAIKAGNEKA